MSRSNDVNLIEIAMSEALAVQLKTEVFFDVPADVVVVEMEQRPTRVEEDGSYAWTQSSEAVDTCARSICMEKSRPLFLWP